MTTISNTELRTLKKSGALLSATIRAHANCYYTLRVRAGREEFEFGRREEKDPRSFKTPVAALNVLARHGIFVAMIDVSDWEKK